MRQRIVAAALASLALTLATGGEAEASSHREAPFLTRHPKVDNTDFYMFRSYEPGRQDYVTIIANYIPLEDAYGGPNYFSFDPDALYEIHIDNTGDAVEDITFQFRFQNALNDGAGTIPGGGIGLDIGTGANQKKISIPFINANVGDPAPAITDQNQNQFRNVRETYTMNVVRGPRRGTNVAPVTHATGPAAANGNPATFVKPLDFVGTKTFGAQASNNDVVGFTNYYDYARAHVYDVNIPGCTGAAAAGKVFVGQRREPFGVLLGNVFDLVNATAAQLTLANGGFPSYENGLNPLARKNVSTIAIEIHRDCLQPNAAEKVVGGWATASLRQARMLNPLPTYDKPSREGGPWVQVSRLGMPLVNEVVIGLKDKDRFNASEPKDDAAFADYVTHPTLPAVLEALFGSANVAAPTAIPRTDLVTAFLTGVPGVNKFVAPNAAVAEMLRLNVRDFGNPRPPDLTQSSTGGSADCSNPNVQCRLGAAACFAAPAAGQAKVLTPTNPGCDPHGFPNGRRPGDDVVDIEIRVAMGYLLATADAPVGDLPFGDAIAQQPPRYENGGNPVFPYLFDPVEGAQIIGNGNGGL